MLQNVFQYLNDGIKAKDYQKIYDALAHPNMDINITTRCLWTPLLLAIEQGDAKITQAFLQMGANPNVPNTTDKENYPLEMAIQKAKEMPEKTDEYVKIIEYLLRHDARAIEGESTELALHQATEFGNLEIVTLLIRYGFDPHKKNEAGETPQDIATRLGHKEVVSFLATSCLTGLIIRESLTSSLEKSQKTKVIPSEIIEKILSFVLTPFERGMNTCAIALTQKRIQEPGIIQKILSFSDFHNRGIIGGREEGIMDAVQANDLPKLNKALSAGYILSDHQVCSLSDTPLMLAAKRSYTPIVERLLQLGGCILSEKGFYLSIEDPGIKDMFLEKKREQMETLKEAFNLADADPSTLQLE
jgi:hypothetical protein